MFISLTEIDNPAGVEPVGGVTNKVGFGIVRWIWKDDDGKIHSFNLEDCRYMPDSKVNLLSASRLGLQLQNSDRGTSVETGIFTSTFVWNERSCERTIRHAENMLPQIAINESTSKFGTFLSAFHLAAEVFKMDAISRSMPLLGQTVNVEESTGKHEGIIIKCLSSNQLVVRFSDDLESIVEDDAVSPISHSPSSESSSKSPPPEVIEHILEAEEEEPLLHRIDKSLDRYQQELLSWHYRLA